MQNTFPHLKLDIAFKNVFFIWSVFKDKEIIPNGIRFSIIYNYKCALCNMCYNGSTFCKLNYRIAEHMILSVRKNLPLSKPSFSSIRELHQYTKHLKECYNYHDNNIWLKLLESLYIHKHKSQVNWFSPTLEYKYLKLIYWLLISNFVLLSL